MVMLEDNGRLIEVTELADGSADTAMIYEVWDITVGDNGGQLFTLTERGDRVELSVAKESVDLGLVLRVAAEFGLTAPD
ncbi:hypothetical protein ACIA49_31980 [Kribbella sp. NPDC051587]|uniref:hypothetical protein n=1 Tax=Kribbella sp. NPDC051587 TaxID=3364119 RepID=UPI00378B7CFA